MPATLDERELVRRTLSGDREAFKLIVLRHQRQLANIVYRQTGDLAGTKHMVQETYLRAYRSLDRFDPRYRLSTWLTRIALNVARDQGRRKKVRDDNFERVGRRERPSRPTPAEAVERIEARETVIQALDHLPPAQREAVVLSIYGGLTQREISELQGTPLGTVKTRLRSAFSKLRDLVAPLHPGGAA